MMSGAINLRHRGLFIVFCVRYILLTCILLTTFACGSAIDPPQYQLQPAVLNGDFDKVQKLLENNSQIDVNWRPGGRGVTALTTAAAYGRLEIAKVLLQRGADPNLGSEFGETPLLAAAYHGDLAMCELLIAAGSDVNKAGGKHGYTPLMNARHKGYDDVAQLLLSRGANR